MNFFIKNIISIFIFFCLISQKLNSIALVLCDDSYRFESRENDEFVTKFNFPREKKEIKKAEKTKQSR